MLAKLMFLAEMTKRMPLLFGFVRTYSYLCGRYEQTEPFAVRHHQAIALSDDSTRHLRPQLWQG